MQPRTLALSLVCGGLAFLLGGPDAVRAASPIDQVARWDSAKLRPEKSIAIDKAVFLYQRTAARYETIEHLRKTGVPAPVLFCLHYRESSNDFGSSLAQGDSLLHRSRNVPRGRLPGKEPPYKWEECAEDAVYVVDRLDLKDWATIQGGLTAITGYNGTGYDKRGVPTPYLWSGTTMYSRGKYVSDGRYSETALDQQLGCVAILKRMMQRGIDIRFASRP